AALPEPMSLDANRPRQRALCYALDLGAPPTDEARLREDLRRHFLDAFEPVQITQVHDGPLLREGVREPALGHPPGQRHLPALKPGALTAARSGFEPLVATRGRLTVPGADAPAHALWPPPGPGGRF